MIHLWGTQDDDAATLTVAELERSQEQSCRSLLNLLHALLKQKVVAPVWLVTRAHAPVANTIAAVTQASLWGLGKALALEHPELWGGLIDLAPEVSLGKPPFCKQRLRMPKEKII